MSQKPHGHRRKPSQYVFDLPNDLCTMDVSEKEDEDESKSTGLEDKKKPRPSEGKQLTSPVAEYEKPIAEADVKKSAN